MRRTLLSGMGAGLLVLAVSCGGQEELKRVEREVGDLKLEVFKMRQAMEEQNRKVEADRGASTEARAQDRRFQADLQETLRLLQESTRVLGNRLGEQQQQPARRPTRDAAPAPQALSEDERAFNATLLDYNRGNFGLAAESLELFLNANPQSPRRPDALFFLGLCHYNEKAFDKAQGCFERILREHPSSSQFLPAKLKRAQCLMKQNLKAAAIRGFQEIVNSFPGTPEARTAQQDLLDLGQ